MMKKTGPAYEFRFAEKERNISLTAGLYWRGVLVWLFYKSLKHFYKTSMQKDSSLLIYCIKLLKTAIYHANPCPVPCLFTLFSHQSKVFDFKKRHFKLTTLEVTWLSVIQKPKTMPRFFSQFSFCFGLTI